VSKDVLHDNGRWHLLRGRAGNNTPLVGQATNDLFGDTGDDKILDKLAALGSGKAAIPVEGIEFSDPIKEVIPHFDPPL
jgi:hypothetical protein